MLDFLSIGYRGFFSLYIKQILHYLIKLFLKLSG